MNKNLQYDLLNIAKEIVKDNDKVRRNRIKFCMKVMNKKYRFYDIFENKDILNIKRETCKLWSCPVCSNFKVKHLSIDINNNINNHLKDKNNSIIHISLNFPFKQEISLNKALHLQQKTFSWIKNQRSDKRIVYKDLIKDVESECTFIITNIKYNYNETTFFNGWKPSFELFFLCKKQDKYKITYIKEQLTKLLIKGYRKNKGVINSINLFRKEVITIHQYLINEDNVFIGSLIEKCLTEHKIKKELLTPFSMLYLILKKHEHSKIFKKLFCEYLNIDRFHIIKKTIP